MCGRRGPAAALCRPARAPDNIRVSEVRGAAPVTLARATGPPCTCCSFRRAAAPFPSRRCRCRFSRRFRQSGAPRSSSTGLRCPCHQWLGDRARRQTRRRLGPGRPPGAAAGGGDGKRKRRAAPGRSRTLEELHACGGRPCPLELGGRRAAACRGEGYSEPSPIARTLWY